MPFDLGPMSEESDESLRAGERTPPRSGNDDEPTHVPLSSGSWLAILIGLIAAVGVAWFLWPRGEDAAAPRTTLPPPEEGVACVHLRDARERFEAGDMEAFLQAVRVAGDAAEGALDQSGQAFGRPEEIALRLDYTTPNKVSQIREARVQRLLVSAAEACDQIPGG